MALIKRRRYPRRQLKQLVGLLCGGEYTIHAGVEIGEGGVLLRSEKPLEEGRPVVVSLIIGGKDFVIIRGNIRYQLEARDGGSPAYGVQFLDIQFEFKRMIRDFISAKTESEALKLIEQTSA